MSARIHGLAVVLMLACAGCAKPSVSADAMALVRKHQTGEAVRVLRERLAKHPDDRDARKMLVRVLAFDGNMQDARIEATELARRSPAGDPVAWIELGHALELTHDFEGALGAYDTASSAAPRSPAGPREGGMRAARWGEAEEAAPRLEEAVRRGATDAETWHTLGLVRMTLGDLTAAEKAYRTGLAVDASSDENRLGLATVAVARGDAAGALASYDALVERHPDYGAAELGRAWALAKLGKKEDARRAIDRAESLGASRESVAKQRAALGE